VSEEKGSKETLLSEDRLSVKTFADTNHNTTRYFAEIEINGRKITTKSTSPLTSLRTSRGP